MDQHEEPRDWSQITRGMLLPIGLLALGLGILWMKKSKPATDTATTRQIERINDRPNRVTDRATPNDSTRKAPTPPGPMRSSIPDESLTTDILSELKAEWLRKVWQANGLSPQPPTIPLVKWQAFVKAAISSELNSGDALDPKNRTALALEILPTADTHPVSAYLVAHVLSKHPSSERLLLKSIAGLATTPDTEMLAFHAAAALAIRSAVELSEAQPAKSKDALNTVKARFEAAATALDKALTANKDMAEVPDPLCHFQLMTGPADDYFEASHTQYWSIVEKHTGLKPWLAKWIEAKHCLATAWEARGDGMINTVDDDGYSKFKFESIKATRLLEESWALKPKDVGPAVTAIYAALGQGNSKARASMDHWFKQALTVQVDPAEGISKMLWGLRPRWYGSTADMIRFGEASLGSQRFDSHLPWALMEAHNDCASEWDVPEAYYLECDYRGLQTLFEGAENEPKRAPWRNVDRTNAAIFSYKCGKYQEAQSWLQKLDFKPNALQCSDPR
jgi:hypothetical protein